MKQIQHNKNQKNRWKNIMALLLSAAMMAPAPGAVYASANPNDGQLLEDRVFEAAGAEEPGGVGNEENRHVHSWSYRKISDNDQEIVASGCQISGCSLSENQIRLTLQVTDGAKRKGFVSADGVELTSDNDLNIPYEIKYYRNDPEVGGVVEWKENIPPEVPGEYQVRAIFAGQEELCLKVDYSIEAAHKHQWNYEGIPSDGSADGRIICSGNADGSVCDVNGDVSLIIKVESENGNKVTVLANGEELTHDHALGIPYEIKYYQNGNEVGTEEAPPTQPGQYKVRAIFDETHCLETDYTIAVIHEHIWKCEKEGTNTVRAICEGEGECKEGAWVEITLNVKKNSTYESAPQTNRAVLSAKTENGSLSPEALDKLEISELTYYKDKKGNPGSLIGTREPKNAGTYHVRLTVGDKETVTIENTFTVSKAKRKNIKVTMGNYERKQKNRPEPGLNQRLEQSAKPVYYYVNKDKKDKKPWKSVKPAKAGVYYMFVVIGETVNYEKYQTPNKEWKKFTVYPDHKWKGMPKELASKEQQVKITCSYCKETKTVILPKRTVSVDLGKYQPLVSGNTGCTFKLKKKENYCTLSSKKGIKINPNPSSYRFMKKSIPVTVKAYGQTYTMNVKPKIPAPKVEMVTKKVRHGNVWGYRFRFKYKIPEADDITVEMEKANAGVKKALRNYVSSPYSTGNSYVDLSGLFLEEELKSKVKFKITANYGRNKSQPTIIELTGKKIGKDKYEWN